MIKERMLEFLILDKIRRHEIPFEKEKYNRKEILKRWMELKKEFLSKYTL